MSGFKSLSLTLLLVLCAAGCVSPARESSPVHPSTDVPEWAKDVVWYQIFPERFRNGDRANDPTVEDLRGSWPHIEPEGWAVSEWTSDWYARPEWERRAHPNFYVSAGLRRYGGDIQGIIDSLPYLDSLGVGAIYLNPVFESPSLHKYDGASYHHVDDNFGPNPELDRRLVAGETPTDPATWTWTSADRLFLDLIAAAHAREIRIIIDGVFNHMGLNSFAFKDVVRRQQESPFADWFTVTSWDDPATPDTSEFEYQGWLGVRTLPEIREDEHGLIRPARDYVFASVRRWMDPNGDGDPSDGIDGWRLDVAEMVELSFWRDFRDFARSINPEAYLVGEVWWEDWQNDVVFNAAPWLQGDAFDAVMNYRWAREARRFFLGADLEPGRRYSAVDFERAVTRLLTEYPPENYNVLMNTYSSHDTDRLASQIANPDFVFDHFISPSADSTYDVSAPSASDRTVQRLMLAHQFTWVGAPHIFYGEEAGMWGADDPDVRKPMVWPGLEYETERAHPLGMDRGEDPVAFDHELFEWYRALALARNAHPALRRGSVRFVDHDGGDRIVAYERTFGADLVWVVINASGADARVVLDVTTGLPAAGHTVAVDLRGRAIVDALSGVEAVLGDGELEIDLPAMTARVWIPATPIR